MSDGRTLSLKLEFRSPWPALHVAYHDPTYKEVQGLLEDSSSEDAALPVVLPTAIEKQGTLTSPFVDYRSVVARIRDLFGTGFWLRPATITAMVALVLMASLLLTRLHVGPPAPMAAELLRQAADAEQALAARTDTVLHRGITVEERNANNGALIARHRIEIWHSAENGITARRVFDDQNNLVAGDWRRADGVQTIYHHGTKPQLQNRNPQSAIRNLEDVWQTDLAAKDFTALISNAQNAHVQETANTYVIGYDATGSVSTASGSDRAASAQSAQSVKSADSSATSAVKTQPATLFKATLTLSKADLHAIEQTLTLQQGNDIREFRMMEISFERRPPSTVAPAVFEPEPELTSSVEPGSRNSKPETGNVTTLAPSPVAATTELEVEVLRLINQSGADLGDQVNVRRTPEGQLLVQGIVETDQRKNEVLRALARVAGNPAVKLKVETMAEALKEQAKSRQSSGPTTVERLESAASKIPADEELRRYFAAKGLSGAQLDQAVNQYAGRIVERSLQALRHAGAMDRLAQRFSLEQLRTLDPEARNKWLGLLRGHALALERELSGLHRDLGPFLSSGSSLGAGQPINSDQDLQQAIHRLFELCSATDQSVRSAFTISESGSGASAIKSPQFFRSLTSAENLAAKIQTLH